MSDAKVRSTSTPPKTARRSRRNASGVRASAASAPSATSHVATYSFSTAARGESSLCVRAPSEEKRRRPDVSASRRPTGCALRGATAARSVGRAVVAQRAVHPDRLVVHPEQRQRFNQNVVDRHARVRGDLRGRSLRDDAVDGDAPLLDELAAGGAAAATDASLRNLSRRTLLLVESALAVVVAHATRSRRIWAWALCGAAKTSLNLFAHVALLL